MHEPPFAQMFTFSVVYAKVCSFFCNMPLLSCVALQFALQCTLDGEEGGLTWRLRVWGLSEECVVVEAPTAFGHPLILDPGVRMRGTIAIGQNRWDFSTEVLSSHGDTLQLKAPSRVRRRRRDRSEARLGSGCKKIGATAAATSTTPARPGNNTHLCQAYR